MIKKIRLIVVGLFALFLLAACSDSSSQEEYTVSRSQQIKLQKKYDKFTANWNALFEKAEVKRDKIIITFDDDDVEAPVADAGLESILENSFKKANAIQSNCHTKLPYEFKDKSSGVISKSSYSGQGWYKQLSDGSHDKIKLNFKTGDTEEE